MREEQPESHTTHLEMLTRWVAIYLILGAIISVAVWLFWPQRYTSISIVFLSLHVATLFFWIDLRRFRHGECDFSKIHQWKAPSGILFLVAFMGMIAFLLSGLKSDWMVYCALAMLQSFVVYITSFLIDFISSEK